MEVNFSGPLVTWEPILQVGGSLKTPWSHGPVQQHPNHLDEASFILAAFFPCKPKKMGRFLSLQKHQCGENVETLSSTQDTN